MNTVDDYYQAFVKHAETCEPCNNALLEMNSDLFCLTGKMRKGQWEEAIRESVADRPVFETSGRLGDE